jgi:hypothetical protein
LVLIEILLIVDSFGILAYFQSEQSSLGNSINIAGKIDILLLIYYYKLKSISHLAQYLLVHVFLPFTAKVIMTPNPSVVRADTPIVDGNNNNNKLLGVVARLDIIREKLNEGFIVIGKREAVART